MSETERKIITKSEKETFEFAKVYLEVLKGGDVVGLTGNLGAGKTVFSKGVAAGLGIKENITSPTFVYMKVYEVENHSSIKKFCHIDAYRLEDELVLVNIGVLEYLGNPSVLTVIEWADRVRNIIKENIRMVNLEISDSSRVIKIMRN